MANIPYFYYADIETFLATKDQEILGCLAENQRFKLANLESTQTAAWMEEIRILRELLPDWKGRGSVLMEYSIPRLGRRIDVVLLIDGIVFILEFKAYNEMYTRADYLQVWDYAIDLQNFHEESHNRVLVPILVSTEAQLLPNNFNTFRENVYYPILANEKNLSQIIRQCHQKIGQQEGLMDYDWVTSRYAPTPTIIEAASALYNNHSVADISRSDAAAENLTRTSTFISDTIQWAEKNQKKAICFVTGVPGAGKTLVGLNTATQQVCKEECGSVSFRKFPLGGSANRGSYPR